MQKMKPLYLQPAFLLGIFLGLGTCLLGFHLASPHLHSSRRDQRSILRHRRDLPPHEAQSPHHEIVLSQELVLRNRRDIKENPSSAGQDVGSAPQQDFPSPSHLPGVPTTPLPNDPDHENLDLELEREKRKKNWLHVELLTSRDPEAETAALMTWAEGVKYHVTPMDTTNKKDPDERIWQGVESACQEPVTRDWYLIVPDTTYVNIEHLQEALMALNADDSLVLGIPAIKSQEIFTAETGVVLSRPALQIACTAVEACTADSPWNHETAEGCLQRETGLDAKDLLKMSDSVYIFPSNLHSHLHLISKALCVAPVSSPDDLYKIHLIFTEHKISQMQGHVFWLAGQMEHDSTSKLRPKRNSPADFEQTVLQSHSSILNSSQEPLTEFFDSSGNVYLDSCKVTKNNVSQSEGFRRSQYLARVFLKADLGTSITKTDYFGFRTIKPLSGLEYQFYHIQENQIHKRLYYYDKLYQVIIKQDYEKIKVEKKQTRAVEDITIVTIADDLEQLSSLLLTLVDNCVGISKTNSKCSILLLYDISLFAREFALEFLTSIIEVIDKRGIKIQTLDIGETGTNSRIMNNFQRAVVSVHETLIENSLIIFLHPKSHITEQFLYRCQANTIPGRSAYFPVPFQFTREGTHIDSDAGFWKNSDFDTFCVHTKDLQKLLILPKSPQMLYQFLDSLAEMEVRRHPDAAMWRNWDTGLCSEQDSQDKGYLKCKQDLLYRNL